MFTNRANSQLSEAKKAVLSRVFPNLIIDTRAGSLIVVQQGDKIQVVGSFTLIR